jgi:hypothetical protein
MTDRVAIGLVLALLAAYGIALLVVDAPLIFIGRKVIDLIQWLAFWR